MKEPQHARAWDTNHNAAQAKRYRLQLIGLGDRQTGSAAMMLMHNATHLEGVRWGWWDGAGGPKDHTLRPQVQPQGVPEALRSWCQLPRALLFFFLSKARDINSSPSGASTCVQVLSLTSASMLFLSSRARLSYLRMVCKSWKRAHCA